jgi:hypothetical protein
MSFPLALVTPLALPASCVGAVAFVKLVATAVSVARVLLLLTVLTVSAVVFMLCHFWFLS